MMKSFGTGLSGLQTNQLFIELIGNNLANVNTIGYRADRASFTDIFSQTVRNGAAPTGSIGGVNSMQVGNGTSVGSIAKIFSQGNLQNTGRTFDLGISGDGFFRLSDGANTFYSRAGAFGLDANESLVDLTTGFNVLGTDGTPITIDSDDVLPGMVTENLELAGNLPGRITGPTTEIAESTADLVTGTPAELIGTAATFPLAFDGDLQITIDGTSFPVTLATGEAIATVTANINAAALAAGITSTIASDDGSVITLVSEVAGENGSVTVTDVDAGAAAAIGFTTGASAAGTEEAATEATLLNDLLINGTDYVDTDTIEFSGVDADGTEITGSLPITAGAPETLGDLIAAMNTAFPGSTITLDAEGGIVMTSDTKGDVALSLSITDGDTNTGSSNWPGLAVTTEGLGPDTLTTSIEIFDENGLSHTVTLDFERTDNDIWALNASIPETDGTVLSGSIADITFADDGTFQSAGSATLQFQFADIGSPQTLTLDFGTPGTFDGLTQFGDSRTAFVKSQDGFPPGELVSVFIDTDGTIQGAYSNGRVDAIDQISTTTFTNPGGLERAGNNLFTRSANSGEPNSGIPGEGGRGVIRSGVLEVSNVDTSQEFVNLIIAQRGFQVNSRVITTTDTILQELISIVR